MEKSSKFGTVSRHYAVQSLFNACYSETLHVTARFLKRDNPACDCRPAEVMRELQEKGLLPAEALGSLRQTCMDCRNSLEQAALAWQSGEVGTLRARLAEYRQASGAVRQELLRLAQ